MKDSNSAKQKVYQWEGKLVVKMALQKGYLMGTQMADP
jgi:hypothetical protein